MSDQITITRALPELKLLDKRINKLLSQSIFVDLFQGKRDFVLGAKLTKDEFTKESKASLESVESLIERRKNIKSAILLSNAKTVVIVGGVQYTVIEAIERKNSIEYEKNLLSSMKSQLAGMQAQIDQQKPSLDKNVEDMIKTNLGTDAKPGTDDYKAIADPFLTANELKIIDPCGIKKRIADLDDEIDKFLSDVDGALTEINSITKIEV